MSGEDLAAAIISVSSMLVITAMTIARLYFDHKSKDE